MLTRGFEEMSDYELRLAAVALVIRYEHTGDELYRRLADEAADVQARRMAAAPNPYEETAMSTNLLTRREGAEVFKADVSRRLWVRGPGRIFWKNAASNARPEQRRTVAVRLRKARRPGAEPATSNS